MRLRPERPGYRGPRRGGKLPARPASSGESRHAASRRHHGILSQAFRHRSIGPAMGKTHRPKLRLRAAEGADERAGAAVDASLSFLIEYLRKRLCRLGISRGGDFFFAFRAMAAHTQLVGMMWLLMSVSRIAGIAALRVGASAAGSKFSVSLVTDWSWARAILRMTMFSL
jgi:hypothetical protein